MVTDTVLSAMVIMPSPLSVATRRTNGHTLRGPFGISRMVITVSSTAQGNLGADESPAALGHTAKMRLIFNCAATAPQIRQPDMRAHQPFLHPGIDLQPHASGAL